MRGVIGLGKTILFAEDEFLTRLELAEALRDSTYTVIEAISGDEAASVLRSGVPVDLIITDIQMPGALDGNALVRLARQDFPEVKILVAAGNRPDPEISRAIQGYFEKPYSPLRVVDWVNRLLGGSRRNGDPHQEMA